ncbi:TTL-domain-containing protein [Decorospora gaudefroyi]|uniref:TTL-domain-containing protein n=1 Tax=Decorospora gaudefroyi TaxID=184978 RepID=A0A6A5JXL7_9PLEO|nr:TTL-domain-containing protein [Decorospora gaudefroyi]
MSSGRAKPDDKIYALINYEDAYVQPLILSALEKRLPPSTHTLITSLSQLPSLSSRLLQFVQYEAIDFDHLLQHPSTSLANAYVIRKALIRKHYLSTTIANWLVKYPDSLLKEHVKPSVAFEVDYAEFLDEALVEAWELKESWARNAERGEGEEMEWWILKPGMSERGQGIRLFSSEEELKSIFEEWDPPESGDEDEEEEHEPTEKKDGSRNGIITSQLRHFIAQPYIHPPLLLPLPSTTTSPPPLHKFHIRTYVLATGALKLHIFRPMLALFASDPYLAPRTSQDAMNAHLTNTCLQSPTTHESCVHPFWSLPDSLPAQPPHLTPPADIPSGALPTPHWKTSVFDQICKISATTFEAAARGMGIHFQPLPNAFEIFGLDFMVSVDEGGGGGGRLKTWLLEVNAFPDFGQTGAGLKGVVGDLFEGVVRVGVAGFFGGGEEEGEEEGFVRVLDVDLGRR